MATTVLAIRSERESLSVLTNTVSNIDNTDIGELFQLPAGFGDCIILGGQVQLSGITTAVLNPETRGPVLVIVGSGVYVDNLSRLPLWRKNTASSYYSQFELYRAVLFRDTELLQLTAFGEDTAAGDTTDVTVSLRVIRRRNL